jgi:hypothetical protein
MAQTAKAFVLVERELKELLAALQPFRTPVVEAVTAEKTVIN